MAISNKWKNILGATGKTQAELAEAIEVGKPTLSGVVNGTQILEWDKLREACAYLEVEAEDVYPDAVLTVLYGTTPKDKPEVQTRSVRLSRQVLEQVDKMVKEQGLKGRRECIERMINGQTELDKYEWRKK